MLARFLSAIATAAVVAALFAGAASSAQAPKAGQAPAAAAAEQKPPKAPKAWPPDAETLRGRSRNQAVRVHSRPDRPYKKAEIPVIASPRIRAWMSCVPS